MRKALIISGVFLGLLAGGVLWALNSTWLSVRLARRAVLAVMPGARVTEFAAAQQRFSWPGQFVWGNVRVGLDYKGRTYRFTASRLWISGVESMAQDKSILRVSVISAQFVSPPGEADEIKADLVVLFKQRKLVLVEGPVRVSGLKWGKVTAQAVSFHLVKNEQAIMISDIRAKAYGGTMSGTARIVPEGPTYYSEIKAEGIDTVQLADLSEQFSSQVVGRATGWISFSGRAGNVSTLESGWNMLDGTRVSAGLLSALMQYIPQSPERKRLELLIKKGDKFSVELLSFSIKSITPLSINGELKLRSREVNLALNPTFDIKMDGTWLSLLDAWKILFPEQ